MAQRLFSSRVLPLIVVALTTLTMTTQAANIFSINTSGAIVENVIYTPNRDDVKSLPRDYQDRDSVNFNVGSENFTLKIGNRWPIHNSPGDYDVLRFCRAGKELLCYEEKDMLIKYTESRRAKSPVFNFSSYADNPYFIDVTLTDKSKALIFMGPQYSVGEPKLLIFVVTESDVKLVLNRALEATNITKSNGEFSMVVESRSSELIGTNPTRMSDPVTHTIWLEDGVLKFKDND